MKYDIKELGDFLVVRVIGNMTAKDKPSVLINAINDFASKKVGSKVLFDLEKVEDIDDDGIDVFISCLSQQSENIEDINVLWAQNLDEKKIEKELKNKIAAPYSEEDDEYGDFAQDLMNLGEAYKEDPNAPMTDCFALVKDDDVYDKLYEAGVCGLMTIYRTREDFTADQGVVLAK
ncbi:MAG: hypothetical protein FWE23_02950 [Chitinivibrionia bacterium]|nr:hypothetical protein [Chitinivibrionia bacterium]